MKLTGEHVAVRDRADEGVAVLRRGGDDARVARRHREAVREPPPPKSSTRMMIRTIRLMIVIPGGRPLVGWDRAPEDCARISRGSAASDTTLGECSTIGAAREYFPNLSPGVECLVP